MPAFPHIAVISSSVDSPFTVRLVTDLRAAGWNVLDVARTDLADAQRHLTQLHDVDTFILVLSAEGLHSAWLTSEIDRILDLASQAPGRRVLPLRLMPLELPDALAAFEPLDFATAAYDAALARLQEVLREGDSEPAPESASEPEPALVGATSDEQSAEAPAGSSPQPTPAPQPLATATVPAATPAAAPATPTTQSAPAQPAEAAIADEVIESPETQVSASRFLGAETPSSRPLALDDVMFTVYAPGEVERRAWMRLLVYASRETRYALAQVAADAEARLTGARSELRPLGGQRPSTLKPGARLSLVPTLPGFAFDPPAQTIKWEDSVQRHELRLRATTAPAAIAARGSLRVFAGPLLLAEVPLAVMVREPGDPPDAAAGYASTVARAYRRFYASFAPADTDLARSITAAAASLGDPFLAHALAARAAAGDDRWPRFIAEAEVVALFWSQHAARSSDVEREWRAALAVRAPRGYLRGFYWSPQPYPIPAELRSVPFDPARTGLRARPFTFPLLARR